MLCTVYKITNNINGKIYIGAHQTEDLNDNYMGSGKLIKKAINKYGKENFTKEILAIFDSPDQMFNEERNIISIIKPQYNIHEGGLGGFENYFLANPDIRKQISALGNAKRKWLYENDKEWYEKEVSRFRANMQKADRSKQNHRTFLGKKHTEETKRRISITNSIKSSGSKNSQYGKFWITNGVESKSIFSVDLIPEGWYKGRVIKK